MCISDISFSNLDNPKLSYRIHSNKDFRKTHERGERSEVIQINAMTATSDLSNSTPNSHLVSMRVWKETGIELMILWYRNNNEKRRSSVPPILLQKLDLYLDNTPTRNLGPAACMPNQNMSECNGSVDRMNVNVRTENRHYTIPRKRHGNLTNFCNMIMFCSWRPRSLMRKVLRSHSNKSENILTNWNIIWIAQGLPLHP